MSNVLKVSYQEAIRSLDEKGWSQRRIARELGINGRTVRRYIERESRCSTISTPGSSEESNSKCTSISTPRLGECGGKGTGGLDYRRFGPQELGASKGGKQRSHGLLTQPRHEKKTQDPARRTDPVGA